MQKKMIMETTHHRKKFIIDLRTEKKKDPINTIERFCKESLKRRKSLIKISFRTRGNEYINHKSSKKRYTRQTDINDFFNTRKELFYLRSQIDTILQGRSKDKSLISNLSKKLEMMEQNFHPMKIQIDLLEKKLKELEKKNS